MIRQPLRHQGRRVALRAAAVAGLVATAALPMVALSPLAASAAAPTLQSANIPNYTGVLASASGRTLYLLSTEHGAVVHCKGACLSYWHPLVVRSAVKSVAAAGTVKGKVGFVARSSSSKQVTFNGYPVYTYAGDTGAHQSKGEAVAAYGGTWHMLRASAVSPGATPVDPLLQAASPAGYGGVLASSASRTLYLLTAEQGATLKCTAACLKTWLPLLVTSSTTSVATSSSVKGTVGFVKRSASARQVTFNSYPVYTYTGDTGPNQSSGEGISADGGTWKMLHASATTAATTPVAPGSGGGGGGGGWSRIH